MSKQPAPFRTTSAPPMSGEGQTSHVDDVFRFLTAFEWSINDARTLTWKRTASIAYHQISAPI